MSQIKISIIIPTYKPQAYIYECLNALKNQTFPKEQYEIIIVLNGCCSPWKEELETFISEQMSECNVVFRQTDTGGVSNARNIALSLASGEYVTFLDDDDYYSESTLSSAYAKADGESVIIFKPIAFKDNTREEMPYDRTDEFNRNSAKGKVPFYKVRKNFGVPWMKFFPMSVLEGRKFNTKFKNGEDALFMFLISDRMKNVVFASDDAIYYRRVRENSACTAHQPFSYMFKNSLGMSMEYTRIFFSHLGKYRFSFYVTRILGSIKMMIMYRKLTY